MSINYYRCEGDCLEIIAVEGTLELDDRCSVCNGRWSHMGRVSQNQLVVGTEHLSVCNHSCTHAAGPICDCRCNSANHGTGRVVERTIVNGIPHIPPYDLDKAVKRRNEYRPLRKEIERKVEAFKWAAGYDSHLRIYAFLTHCWRVRDAYKKIKNLKSHFHRMKNGKLLLTMMESIATVRLPKMLQEYNWDYAGKFNEMYNQKED